MDTQKAMHHHRRIDVINIAIKKASNFVDHQAYCSLDGEEKLYTLEQLTEILNKEEEALRACA